MSDIAEDDDDPRTCYCCGTPIEDYLRILCDECRKRAKAVYDSIERARRGGE